MRTKLRDEPPEYVGTRDNFAHSDHAMRTMITAGMIATVAPKTILDPACGDASILEVAYRMREFEHADLWDLSQLQVDVIEPSFPHTKQRGDLFDALEIPGVFDFILLTEILEHLEDPDMALRLARLRGNYLIASSPIGDPEDGRNHEHLWAWEEDDYEQMLRDEGWDPFAKAVLTYPGAPWKCQILMAR